MEYKARSGWRESVAALRLTGAVERGRRERGRRERGRRERDTARAVRQQPTSRGVGLQGERERERERSELYYTMIKTLSRERERSKLRTLLHKD